VRRAVGGLLLHCRHELGHGAGGLTYLRLERRTLEKWSGELSGWAVAVVAVRARDRRARASARIEELQVAEYGGECAGAGCDRLRDGDVGFDGIGVVEGLHNASAQVAVVDVARFELLV